MSFPFILTPTALTIFPAGEPPISLTAESPNMRATVEAIRAGDWEEALDLARAKTFVTTATKGLVEVRDEGVYYAGEKLTNYLTTTILSYVQEQLPVDHLVAFLTNLMANPSATARRELYLFLEAAKLPITPEGHFLAYKAVQHDFTDKHTGTFNNYPGATLVMERGAVDDDRNKTCSEGFHAAAYEYAKNFMHGDDRLVVVRINPADVVSIPADHNNQKLRTCRYVVVEEVKDASDTLTNKLHADQTTPDFDIWDVDDSADRDAFVEGVRDEIADVLDDTFDQIMDILRR